MRTLALSFIACLSFLACSSSDEGSVTTTTTSTSDVTSSTGAGAGGSGGATSSSSTGGSGGGAVCPSPEWPDPNLAMREKCTYKAGSMAVDTLGITPAMKQKIPIEHLVIVMQENRSFDHYLGHLGAMQPDAEAEPAGFSNPDAMNAAVKAFHLKSTCLEADPPHQWTAMHAGWDTGKMDGFVKSAATAGSDGHYTIGYYDATDLPFYYWLASTFAMSDHYFGAALGGTWANRDYLYAGTSDGVMSTGQKTISVPNVFGALDAANVSWGVYTDGNPRQDCLGWTNTHKGVGTFAAFIKALGNGSLPAVSFVDPGPGQDEHPPNDVQSGEQWGRAIYDAAISSPLWSKLAIIYTYDESGGLADHVPPPPACLASPDQSLFDRLGVRVPMTVISPWARPHYVSHLTHEHSSTLRLIELLHDLPALTGRDANSDALLDLFDFSCPALMNPPAPVAPGMGGCP